MPKLRLPITSCGWSRSNFRWEPVVENVVQDIDYIALVYLFLIFIAVFYSKYLLIGVLEQEPGFTRQKLPVIGLAVHLLFFDEFFYDFADCEFFISYNGWYDIAVFIQICPNWILSVYMSLKVIFHRLEVLIDVACSIRQLHWRLF